MGMTGFDRRTKLSVFACPAALTGKTGAILRANVFTAMKNAVARAFAPSYAAAIA